MVVVLRWCILIQPATGQIYMSSKKRSIQNNNFHYWYFPSYGFSNPPSRRNFQRLERFLKLKVVEELRKLNGWNKVKI